ncbi:type IV pilin protein [Leptothrix discophora]|uniref:Type IV pilin protein n=1 Tax=Leptothrix discophora TaxID=89 RepID=A0ABT9G0R9_LEPDI|nr:type IV pilin protein [Leptothrix discophora]MDP4300074.1 type IV pilin protein [Leptothrix discophora]
MLRRAIGWSLVELMVGLALLGILSTLAWPSYDGQIKRLRRSDAHVALARLQQAQEQHRSRSPAYADTLGSDGLGLPDLSDAGHYRLSIGLDPARAATAYTVQAMAIGRQADDQPCQRMAIEVDRGQLRRRSGPSEHLDNDSDGNRRCWGSW